MEAAPIVTVEFHLGAAQQGLWTGDHPAALAALREAAAMEPANTELAEWAERAAGIVAQQLVHVDHEYPIDQNAERVRPHGKAFLCSLKQRLAELGHWAIGPVLPLHVDARSKAAKWQGGSSLKQKGLSSSLKQRLSSSLKQRFSSSL